VSELPDLSAGELVALVARGEASCVEVVEAHLDRIDALNPHVNAIVGLRDRAAVLTEAAARDQAARDGAERGPLHGLPLAVKDLSEVAGLPWTRGSTIFRDQVGAVDEPFVARLRAAGAVVVGKTNVPELGFGSQTFNAVYGATRNPYDLGRTIGGSSGGAAAALAARMLPIADGSDYMGSLRNPAAFGNVLGFRPTAGTVVPPGPIAQLGELGPMGRTVADVARLLGVMAARPPAELDGPVAGTRVAWVGDLGGRLATEPGVLELAPLHADPALRAQLKPEVVWEVEHGLAYTALDVNRAAAVRQRWVEAVGALFERFDAVLAPSTQVFPFAVTTPWPELVDGRRMDTYHRWMETVMPWSMAGTPVLGMPAGFDTRGLPTGVQLVGPAGADHAVLRLGRAYEEATQWVADYPPVIVS
jgi:amidase